MRTIKAGTRRTITTGLMPLLLAAGALAGCDTPPEGVAAEDVGSIQLALQSAPTDGLCLRLTVDQPSTTLKVVKLLTLTPNNPSQMQVGNLPVGSVGLVGEVFNVTCPSVTAATPLTWVSDRLAVTISPDLTQMVTLSLRKAGKVDLGVDFVADTQVEEIKVSLPVTALAGAPSGQMLMGLASSAQLWQLSTAFDMKSIATLLAAPGFIAVAPDGNIAATVNSDTQLQVLTGAGALRSTLTLGFTAGGVVVDSTGTGWVSSTSAPRVMRVANVAGSTAPTMLAITTPTIVAPGIGLAADGTPRVGIGSPGSLLTLSAAGSIVSSLSTPIVPRGIASLADGTLYILGFNTGANVYKVTTAGAISSVASMTTAPTTATIISTPKGVVFAPTSGGLSLIKTAASSPQSIRLPGNAVISNLALSAADGRVWASDSATSRLLVVTLP